jgi:hypothetical protein
MEIRKCKLIVKKSKKLENCIAYKCVGDGIFVDVISKDSLREKMSTIKGMTILTLENVILQQVKSKELKDDGTPYYNHKIFVGFPNKNSADLKDID